MTDDGAINSELQKAYDKEVAGFTFIRMPKDQAQKQKLQQWLKLDNAETAIHLMDPHGDRMMRFATNPDAPDFKKMSKDMEKLLKWNPTGKVN